ncbi:MAG: pilin [Patescibacteria group bacterium]|nr:pilin [Patescibacteria group bacterium]
MKNLKTKHFSKKIFPALMVSIFCFSLLSMVVFSSGVVNAQIGTGFGWGGGLGSTGGTGSPVDLQPVNVVQVIRNIVNWIFWFLIMFAVIMFLFGGFQYVTASGDADKIKTANKNILYALIGLAIGFAAKGIVALIGAITGQNVGF